MSSLKIFLAIGVIAAAGWLPAKASDADDIARALSAAPTGVASGAAVVRVGKDGSMTTLRPGTNGYTCLVIGPLPAMCADANSLEFMRAYMKHAPPPDKNGLAYMLQGDNPGASNTDPYATSKTADNHWIVTGPHIMLFGPASKTLGYPTTPDADPTKPYMMWAGTPYEHAMIPVAPSK
jgi:hypothetical protein